MRLRVVLTFVWVLTSILGVAEEGDDRASVIRVATYNVDRGLDLEGLVRALAEHAELRAVDVLMVQEIEERPDLDTPRMLAAELGLDVIYAAARPLGEGSHGIALLSRPELSDPEVVPLPRYELGYRSRRRVAIGATLTEGGQRLRLYNVHLDTRLTLEQRIAQLEPVLTRALREPHAIIGGDLNTIDAVPALLPWVPLPFPGSGQAEALDRFMHEQGFDAPLSDVGSTGPLGMRLDGIYTRGVEVMGAGKVRFRGVSDHAALWVDLAITEEGRTR